jgi:DNA-binding response OmpR family regulator
MKLAGSRLLLVEDEPIIGFALEDMMNDEGAETVLASSLQEALGIARSQTFDGAIVDVNLHGEESFPLVRELAASGVRAVFATGYGTATLPEDLAHVRAIAKPYDVKTIREAFAD